MSHQSRLLIDSLRLGRAGTICERGRYAVEICAQELYHFEVLFIKVATMRALGT